MDKDQLIRELLDALEGEHRAVDTLLAQIARTNNEFAPSKSPVWPAVEKGWATIQKARAAIAQGRAALS